MSSADLLAMTRDQAARLARVTSSRLQYWQRTGLVVPSIQSDALGRSVHLYDHRDLMGALVVAELRERGLSLQHIRRVVRYLQGLGHDQPLTAVRYAVVGSEIYFQHDDGEWEGDRRPGQGVMPDVLHLEPIRSRIRAAATREPTSAGRTERRRGALGSKEVFADTRIPVDTVRRYLASGASDDEVLRSFPALQRRDLDTARQSA